MEYSISELIDQLSILNIKIFILVDKVQNAGENENISSDAKKLQELNSIRSKVKREIDLKIEKTSKEIKI